MSITLADGITLVTPTSLPPSGAAGGSLAGTYPNPSIATDVVLPGNPTTTTQALSDDSTRLATTAFVNAALINFGPINFQGTWNATTNSPTLTSSMGTKGYAYIVSVAGSTNLDGITDWNVGDFAVYSGAVWQKIDSTDAVASVFGRIGAVVAMAGDYTADQVTNVPAGTIAATDVQGAIDELDTEKQAIDGFVPNETPAGAVDGMNDTFTLANTPVVDSVQLSRNGALQTPITDYTISGAIITFIAAPLIGSVLNANYRK